MDECWKTAGKSRENGQLQVDDEIYDFNSYEVRFPPFRMNESRIVRWIKNMSAEMKPVAFKL